MQKRLSSVKSISSIRSFRSIFSPTGEGNEKDRESVPSIAAQLEKTDDDSVQNLDEFLVWSNSKVSRPVSRTSNARPETASWTDHKDEPWLHELQRVHSLPMPNRPPPMRPQRPDDDIWIGLPQALAQLPTTAEARKHETQGPITRIPTSPPITVDPPPKIPLRFDDNAWPERARSSSCRITTAEAEMHPKIRDNIPPPFIAKGPPVPERAVSLEQERELDTWWFMLSIEKKMAIKGKAERYTEGFI